MFCVISSFLHRYVWEAEEKTFRYLKSGMAGSKKAYMGSTFGTGKPRSQTRQCRRGRGRSGRGQSERGEWSRCESPGGGEGGAGRGQYTGGGEQPGKDYNLDFIYRQCLYRIFFSFLIFNICVAFFLYSTCILLTYPCWICILWIWIWTSKNNIH